MVKLRGTKFAQANALKDHAAISVHITDRRAGGAIDGIEAAEQLIWAARLPVHNRSDRPATDNLVRNSAVTGKPSASAKWQVVSAVGVDHVPVVKSSRSVAVAQVAHGEHVEGAGPGVVRLNS